MYSYLPCSLRSLCWPSGAMDFDWGSVNSMIIDGEVGNPNFNP